MYSDKYIYSISNFAAKNYGQETPVEDRDVFSSIEKVLDCEDGLQIRWAKSLGINGSMAIEEGERVEIVKRKINSLGEESKVIVVYQGLLTKNGIVNTFFYNPYYDDWPDKIDKIGKEIKGT